MKITSAAFDPGGKIPAKYTCDGENVSPPLDFSDVPEGTTSLTVIVDDPDAPSKTWVHWVAWNMDPSKNSMVENTGHESTGTNDFGTIGYKGPCPPSGTHRYFFKLYALDTTFDLTSVATKETLEKAMEGHILDRAELVGIYERK